MVIIGLVMNIVCLARGCKLLCVAHDKFGWVFVYLDADIKVSLYS